MIEVQAVLHDHIDAGQLALSRQPSDTDQPAGAAVEVESNHSKEPTQTPIQARKRKVAVTMDFIGSDS